MLKLNPYVKTSKRAAILAQERAKEARKKVIDKKRKVGGKKQWNRNDNSEVIQ